MTADASAAASVTVPALSAVVLRADREVTAPDAATDLVVSAPVAGAGVTGVDAGLGGTPTTHWRETSFAWRVVGSDEWHALGTAEDTEPRVFHDVGGPRRRHARRVPRGVDGCRGPALRRIDLRLGGQQGQPRRAEEEPEEPIDFVNVSIPGSLNTEMGCASDWAPGLRPGRR